jgi:uncharacterized protein YebE (UPF0316 family)
MSAKKIFFHKFFIFLHFYYIILLGEIMNIILYFIIFISKTIELALGTLRIIVIANGRKIFGAILQGVIAIVWMCITGVVIVNITKDPFKIVAFALGSAFGSYVGSMIEEKMAIGSNMLIIVIKKELEEKIISIIKDNGYKVTKVEGCDKEKSILVVVLTRKDRKRIVNLIRNEDKDVTIIANNAFKLNNKKRHNV